MQRAENSEPSGCACCAMNRRRFLANCAACAAGGVVALTGAGCANQHTQPVAAQSNGGKTEKAKVRLVFAHTSSDGPIWPNIGYDFEKRKKQLIERLTVGCPGLEITPVTVMNHEQATKLLADSTDADGYLVYLLSCWAGAARTVAHSGRPTLLVDDLYCGSGEFLIENAALRRAGSKTSVGVSSGDMNDVIAAARCFQLLKQTGKTPADFTTAVNESWKKHVKHGNMHVKADKLKVADPGQVLERLKKSTILVIGAKDEGLIKAIDEVFGVKVIPLEFKELEDLYDKADKDQATEWADKWIKAAEKLVEPKRDEVIRSACNFLAQKELMKKYNAQGITINCLGGFYGGQMKAYPCLGFSQFNSNGLIGGCEADLQSAITMMVINYLTGRPGYISDPVIDTSKNRIIYAHCVAPTKMFGPDGPSNPYQIRSHSEDRKGAVVRSLMPLGYLTTAIKFNPVTREVVFHQGKAVENVDEDKACRNKLAVEVKGDIDKLFGEWDKWSWHRVTFYGDGKEAVQEMAKALKVKVIEEA